MPVPSPLKQSSLSFLDSRSLWNLLALLPWAVGIVVLLVQSRNDQMTATREQTIAGQIISHEVPNHGRYLYRYEVNGQSFRGWATPQTSEYKVGQEVAVYYDPVEPNKSSLSDFAKSGRGIFNSVLFCACGMWGVSLLIYLRRPRSLLHRRRLSFGVRSFRPDVSSSKNL